LVKTSETLKKYIVSKKIDGVEELKSDFQNNKPEIVFALDRERANREGYIFCDRLEAICGLPFLERTFRNLGMLMRITTSPLRSQARPKK
jgi:hypothetical protein